MSKTTLPYSPTGVKPEPPHPILDTLRMIEAACVERDRMVAEGVLKVCRKLEGRE